MADQHIGYPGSVSSVQLAAWMPNVAASRYSVEDVTHGQVVTNLVGDRGVSVLPGTVIGDGIMDVFETATNLNFASVTGPDRWDMVVLRRTWNPTPGASTSVYTIIQGGPNRALPARNNNKGSVADQPMALCRIKQGASSVQEIIDLRCWADNSGLVAVSDLVMSYQDQVGTDITIGQERWLRTLTIPTGNSAPTAYWHRVSAGGTIQLNGWGGSLEGGDPNRSVPPQFRIQAGTLVQTSDGAGYGRVNFNPAFPNGLLYVSGSNGDDYATGGSLFFASAGEGSGWSQQGIGRRDTWVYAVLSQPASSTGTGSIYVQRRPNMLHRINWIAIGW